MAEENTPSKDMIGKNMPKNSTDKPALIVALDYTDVMDALSMATILQGTVPWMKVGLELFTSEGPKMLHALKEMGYKVMLDLKLFDIPNTVAGGLRSASFIGADIVTVHTLGGERMIRAAVQAVDDVQGQGGSRPRIFGITVLTSFEEGELPCYAGSLKTLASDLAYGGQSWGLDGVVCSGHELASIKARCPDLQCLTPGIRMQELTSSITNDDQRRVMTPKEAVQAGSNFLVVGRPITHAKDPVSAAQKIIANMQEGI